MIDTGDFNSIAKAISAYAQVERADAALLTSTALVGSDARITDSGEGYTGTLRWLDYSLPATTHKQTETAGDESINMLSISNKSALYIKNVDHVAAQEISIQRVTSKVDGLAYLGAQFAKARATREDTQLRSVLNGCLAAMTLSTASTPAPLVVGTSDAAAVLNDFTYYTGSSASDVVNPLFALETTANNRSAFFDVLFDALTAVKGEFEEPFYYLVISSDTYNTLRKQNVLDVAPVVDGNFNFSTILGGKMRLVVNNQILTGGLDSKLKVSFIVKPGAFHYSEVAQVNPTALERNELAGNGGGAVTILSRWGNIMHPKGFTWAGSATAFPANSALVNKASWTVTAGNVNEMGLFPILHG
jgi:hypothetical protein